MKPKIPARKVTSDTCVINVGQVIEDGEITDPGTPYYVHEGEWVEVMPVLTVKEVMQLSRLQKGSEDAGVLDDNLAGLCRELSKRIVNWNWTDLMGEPLASPLNHPEVLEELSSDELMWLINAASNQEMPDERKKGSKASVNTSLATAPSQ